MSQAPIPAGYHDADSAALLLGVTKRQLLKQMRELGWLHVGGDLHNLPRHELKHAGWLATHDRAHCLKGKKEIVKSYQVMLLSQTGFHELKKIMHKNADAAVTPAATAEPPTPEKKCIAPVPAAVTEFNEYAADAERKKMLQQMAEWNLPIASGRN